VSVRARRVQALAAAALVGLGLAAASPARAELRRVEAVGAVPIREGAAPSLRQAALHAALAEAALQAARSLFETEAGKPPPEDLGAALGATPEDYAVSYRLVEDRGEQPALLTGQGPNDREYVVLVEVQVDVGRLRDRLRERGRLAGAPPLSEAPTRFRLEVLDLPSARAYTAIRGALDAAGGTVVPLELEPRRALLQVSGLPAAQAVERLRVAQLPPDLWIEPLEPEAPGAPARVRVRLGTPPGPPVELEAPSGEGAPTPAPGEALESAPADAPPPAPAEPSAFEPPAAAPAPN